MADGVSAPEIGTTHRSVGADETPSDRPVGRSRGTRFAFFVSFLVLAAVRHWDTMPSGAFQAVAAVAFSGGVLLAARDGQRLRLLRLFLTVTLAFSVVSLASVTQSTEREAALEAWTRLVFAQALGLGCYLLTADRRRLVRFTFGGVAGVGLIAAGSMGMVPFGSALLDHVDDAGRLSGAVGDPNFFGQFLAVGLALAVATVRGERRTTVRLFALAVAGLTLMAAIGTESRGTLLAIVAIGGIHVVRSSGLVRLTLVAAVVLAVVLAPAEAVNENAERLARVPSSVNEALEFRSAEDTAVGGRLSELIASAEMVRDHPLLGIGIGTYRYRYLEYAVDIGIDKRGEERDAHSRPLEVAAETGFLGAVAWIAVLVTCGVLCASSVNRRARPADLNMAAVAWTTAFAGWFITAVFLHDYQPELEWLVIGAVFGMAETVRSHGEDDQPALRPISSSYSATS